MITLEPQTPAPNSNCPNPARPKPAQLAPEALPDWLLLLPQAREGDTQALLQLCQKAVPLRDRICNKEYYVTWLGKDEACSIATESMIDFLLYEPLRNASPQDIPRMLAQAIKCDLINQVRRLKMRNHYETHHIRSRNSQEDTEEDKDELANLPADSREEPENRLLQAELNRRVQACIKQLRPKEQTVINSLFFRQLSVTETARELGCTPGSVTMTKRRAMEKLRKLFIRRHVV